jgi:hypothetical protein
MAYKQTNKQNKILHDAGLLEKENLALSSRSSPYLQIHIFKTFETIYVMITKDGFDKKLCIV